MLVSCWITLAYPPADFSEAPRKEEGEDDQFSLHLLHLVNDQEQQHVPAQHLQMQSPIPALHHPSDELHNPSAILHHPSAVLHHPSAVLVHPSAVLHHPSAVLHHPRSLAEY